MVGRRSLLARIGAAVRYRRRPPGPHYYMAPDCRRAQLRYLARRRRREAALQRYIG